MTIPMSSLPGACHVGGLAFADQHHLQFDHSPGYHGRRSEGFEVTHELDHVTWPWLGFERVSTLRLLGMATSEDFANLTIQSYSTILNHPLLHLATA